MDGYGLIFTGSPIQKQILPEEVRGFLSKLHPRTGNGFAGFITHSTPAYPPQVLERMVQPFTELCERIGMENQGVFDCQGYLADEMHGTIQEMRKLGDAAWAERVAQMKGHPNGENLSKAMHFAESVLSN